MDNPWSDSTTKTKVQVLSREKDGSVIVYVKGKPFSWLSQNLDPLLSSSGVHLHGLFELRDGKLKTAYIGNTRQVSKFLRGLNDSGIKYKVLSLDDARFSPDSPLYALTEKQRRILISAFRLGYFEIPRKISFEQLSKSLSLGRSTVNEHLRRAELRLVSRLLSD